MSRQLLDEYPKLHLNHVQEPIRQVSAKPACNIRCA